MVTKRNTQNSFRHDSHNSAWPRIRWTWHNRTKSPIKILFFVDELHKMIPNWRPKQIRMNSREICMGKNTKKNDSIYYNSMHTMECSLSIWSLFIQYIGRIDKRIFSNCIPYQIMKPEVEFDCINVSIGYIIIETKRTIIILKICLYKQRVGKVVSITEPIIITSVNKSIDYFLGKYRQRKIDINCWMQKFWKTNTFEAKKKTCCFNSSFSIIRNNENIDSWFYQ